MHIKTSEKAPAHTVSKATLERMERITESQLKRFAGTIAIPRSYEFEPENNRIVGEWIAEQLRSWGYDVALGLPATCRRC